METFITLSSAGAIPFKNKMFNFFMDQEFVDIDIMLADGKIHAHSLVLASESNKLYKMLKSQIGVQKTLILKEFTKDTMQNALEYIYRGYVTYPKYIDREVKAAAAFLELEGTYLDGEQFDDVDVKIETFPVDIFDEEITSGTSVASPSKGPPSTSTSKQRTISIESWLASQIERTLPSLNKVGPQLPNQDSPQLPTEKNPQSPTEEKLQQLNEKICQPLIYSCRSPTDSHESLEKYLPESTNHNAHVSGQSDIKLGNLVDPELTVISDEDGGNIELSVDAFLEPIARNCQSNIELVNGVDPELADISDNDGGNIELSDDEFLDAIPRNCQSDIKLVKAVDRKLADISNKDGGDIDLSDEEFLEAITRSCKRQLGNNFLKVESTMPKNIIEKIVVVENPFLQNVSTETPQDQSEEDEENLPPPGKRQRYNTGNSGCNSKAVEKGTAESGCNSNRLQKDTTASDCNSKKINLYKFSTKYCLVCKRKRKNFPRHKNKNHRMRLRKSQFSCESCDETFYFKVFYLQHLKNCY